LVTGTFRGIGLAIAQALGANGVMAVLNGRDQMALSQRVEEITGPSNPLIFWKILSVLIKRSPA
jgi:NAD(P)-dependent dehydrogenase (short-subunit alcohol dehydrogenase family)